MAEVALTSLKFGAPDTDGMHQVKIIPAGTEVKSSDFPEGVYDEFKESGAIGTPPQPTAAMEEENATLKAQIEELKKQLASNKQAATPAEKPPAK